MHECLMILPACAVLFAAGCTRDAGRYVAKGDELAARRQTEAAILQYRKALQKDPAYGRAYLRLGTLEGRQGKWREAVDAFLHAAALLPKQPEPRVRLADLCLAIFSIDPKDWPPALQHTFRQMVSELESLQPGGFDTLRLKGTLLLMDKHPAEALTLLRQAAALHPEDHNVTIAVVHALAGAGQKEQGKSVGWQLIRSDKTFLPICDELHSQALLAKDDAEARRVREECARNNPKSADAMMALAEEYYRQAQIPSLDRVLEKVSTDTASFPEGRLLVGQFLFRRGELDRARPILIEGGRQHPEDLRYPRTLALLLNSLGRQEEALRILADLVRRHPDDSALRMMRASMLVESGKQDNVAVARSEFEDLLRAAPNSPDALYGLGRAEFLQGSYAQAKSALLKIVDRVSDPTPAKLALGEIAIAERDPRTAINYANEVLAQKPNSALAHLLHAKALAFSGQTTPAIRELLQLQREHPKWIDGIVELGRAYLIAKRFDLAETAFRGEYRPGSSDLRLAEGLASAAIARGQPQAAISIWQEEVRQARDPLPARLTLARTALMTRNFDIAVREYTMLSTSTPGDAQVFSELARAHLASGNPNAAIDTLRKACDLQPSSVQRRVEFAALLSGQGRWSEAAEEYGKALRQEPANPALLNDRAYALAEGGVQLDEAARLAEQALRAVPNERQIRDTLGWIYVKRHMADAAIPVLQAVVKEEPGQASFHYHLALAFSQKGLVQDARRELNEALKYPSSTIEQNAIRSAVQNLN